jgi:hypothetical protein
MDMTYSVRVLLVSEVTVLLLSNAHPDPSIGEVEIYRIGGNAINQWRKGVVPEVFCVFTLITTFIPDLTSENSLISHQLVRDHPYRRMARVARSPKAVEESQRSERSELHVLVYR